MILVLDPTRIYGWLGPTVPFSLRTHSDHYHVMRRICISPGVGVTR
ncbi:uncharacterized protein METZ01_LOCUS349964 [marine metagenome]|uniref:Uncharacterized protein n=1 Tax=marine metagenome TaxID=408172 RepID=A0A382RI58_9ZZZZ